MPRFPTVVVDGNGAPAAIRTRDLSKIRPACAPEFRTARATGFLRLQGQGSNLPAQGVCRATVPCRAACPRSDLDRIRGSAGGWRGRAPRLLRPLHRLYRRRVLPVRARDLLSRDHDRDDVDDL